MKSLVRSLSLCLLLVFLGLRPAWCGVLTLPWGSGGTSGDSSGGTATPPKAEISSPSSGATFTSGDFILFINDAGNTNAGDTLRWYSSKDGELGTGNMLTLNSLSAGTHYITLFISNSAGVSSTASTQIQVTSSVTTVQEKPYTPTAKIMSPNSSFGTADPNALDAGDEVIFNGMGDNVDGETLEWYSSKDGYIGSGNLFRLDTLTPGMHTITLIVTTKFGISATNMIPVFVKASLDSGSVAINAETEPNNDKASTDPLTSGVKMFGQLLSDADEDWFSITTTQADILSLNFSYQIDTTGDALIWSITIYNAADVELANLDINTSLYQDQYDLNTGVSAAGTYYIKVSISGQGLSDLAKLDRSHPYTLTVTPLNTPPHASSSAMRASYSSRTTTLHIPNVVVDGGTSYQVDLQQSADGKFELKRAVPQ